MNFVNGQHMKWKAARQTWDGVYPLKEENLRTIHTNNRASLTIVGHVIWPIRLEFAYKYSNLFTFFIFLFLR